MQRHEINSFRLSIVRPSPRVQTSKSFLGIPFFLLFIAPIISQPFMFYYCVESQFLQKRCGVGGCTHQNLHSTVQRMSMVPSELGINTFQRRITVGLWLLDSTIQQTPRISDPVPLVSAVLAPPVLHLGGFQAALTRFCGPSSTGCAATSSLILHRRG
jgi:hypothetical protein